MTTHEPIKPEAMLTQEESAQALLSAMLAIRETIRQSRAEMREAWIKD